MKIGKITMKDYLKAIKIGNREADKEIGFVRQNKVHQLYILSILLLINYFLLL